MEISEQTKLEIERAVSNLMDKKAELTTAKKQYELKISLLNSRVRGKTLSAAEYSSVCEEQNVCKAEMLNLQVKINELNADIQKKRNLGEDVRIQLGKVKVKTLNLTAIIDNLIVLRDNYMSFASDVTRVSSTRVMASKFSEELNALMSNGTYWFIGVEIPINVDSTITQFIRSGFLNTSPSEDAIFNALALKADNATLNTFTITDKITLADNEQTITLPSGHKPLSVHLEYAPQFKITSNNAARIDTWTQTGDVVTLNQPTFTGDYIYIVSQ